MGHDDQTIAAAGERVNDLSSASLAGPSMRLAQALVGDLSYDELAQAAVDAIPGEFGADAQVLGAMLCTVDTAAHTLHALAFTHGPNREAIERALAGRPVRALAGDYRREANLVERAVTHRAVEQGVRLKEVFAGVVPDAAADALERALGWRGGLVVPMPVQGRNVGVLVYALAKHVAQVSADEREQMLRIAQFIALALEQARLFDLERRRASEAAALQTVLHRLATAENPRAVLDEVLSAAEGLLGADCAAVLAAPDRAGEQPWRVTRGARSEFVERMDPPSPGRGLAGRAMAAGQPVLIERFGADPAFPPDDFPLLLAEGVRSALAAPLLRPREQEGGANEPSLAFGALVLGCRSPRRFGPEDVNLATTLAQYAAVALERDRLLALERLRAEELQATFQAVGEAIALYDRDGKPLRINRALERMLGMRFAAYVAMTPEERGRRFAISTLDGERLPFTQLPVVRAMRGERVQLQVRITRQDGRGGTLESEVIATPLRGRGVVLVMRDIGHELRRRRELEALIASGKQVSAEIDQSAVLRAIAAAAAETVQARGAAVAVVEAGDMDGSQREDHQGEDDQHHGAQQDSQRGERLVFREWYRDHAWQLVGEARQPWEGVSGRALATGEVQVLTPSAETTEAEQDQLAADLPPTDRQGGVLALPISSRQRVLAVVVLLGKQDGSSFDDDDVRVLRAFSEQAATALENARLFEEERRARQQLEEAQEQGQIFLSFIAHELKTPLTNVLGFAQLAEKFVRTVAATAPEQGARGLNAVQKILDNTRRLQRLVDDLQEAFRIGSGRFTPRPERCDLTMLARQAVEEQQAVSEQHQIIIQAPEEPIIGRWEGERLRQLLTNLLTNAVKYSPEGGPVTVTLRPRRSSVVLTVADHGLGVPRQDLPALFQPYSRLHRSRGIRGTGLGLYIVKGIVEAHGGSVRAESAGEGKGTTFTIVLPLGGEEG